MFPKRWRERAVAGVRKHSQAHRPIDASYMDVVPQVLIKHARRHDAQVLIHGHTHKPGIILHEEGSYVLQRIVLSDWDETPQVLCYDKSKGFYFHLITTRN